MMQEEIQVQVEETLPKLERSIRPMTYVSWLLGVGIARPNKVPKPVTIILRVIHFGVCSVIVAYGAIDFFTIGSIFKSDIFKIMYYMNKVVCYFASYYYVIHGIRHYRKWPELMKKMESLDQRIRKEVSMSDGFIRNSQILAILIASVLGPISMIVHALYYFYTLPENILASDLLLYYTIAQSLVNSFVFDIIVFIVSRRFRAINEIIEGLDVSLGTGWVTLKIRKIRELHNGGCDVVATINDIYGIHLLFGSANSFTMVVAKLFRIYMSVVENNHAFILINNVIWMIYLGQFAITCYVCNEAIKESNKSAILMHNITLNAATLLKGNKFSFTGPSNGEPAQLESADSTQRFIGFEGFVASNFDRASVRNEVNDFSSQLQQHRVAFTACDFFELNNSLFTGFIGVITTYLIILVQFYRPDNLNAPKFSRRR